jgi:hypothetical protein
MPIVRKRAQIVHADPQESLGLRPPYNPMLEDAGKEPGKYRDDLKPHSRYSRS